MARRSSLSTIVEQSRCAIELQQPGLVQCLSGRFVMSWVTPKVGDEAFVAESRPCHAMHRSMSSSTVFMRYASMSACVKVMASPRPCLYWRGGQ